MVTIDVERVAACPLCHHSARQPFRECPDWWRVVDGMYRYVRCTTCAFVYLLDRPTAADLSKCYPDTYGPYVTATNDVGSRAAAELVLRAIRKVTRAMKRRFPDPASEMMRTDADEPGNGRVLMDYGCGSADYLDSARARGWRTVGVDFNQAVVDRVRAAGHDAYVADDLPSVRNWRGTVSRVRMNHVLEHLTEPVETLRQLRELLEPGGIIRVAVPNVDGLSSRLFRGRWRAMEPRHLVLFSPVHLEDALHRSGFTAIDVRGQSASQDVVKSIEIVMTRRAGFGPPGGFANCLIEALHPLARAATARGAPDRLQATARP